MRRVGAALLLFIAGLLPVSARAEMVAFGSTRVGDLPSGFEIARTGGGLEGVWAVVVDQDADGGRALEQRTPDPTDYRFPLAIYTPALIRDLEVTTRFKPVSGEVDRAGGIAVRVMDANNYYVVRANALENNVRFYRVVRGERRQIAGFNTRVSSGEWHTLGIRVEGDQFTVSFDRQRLFTAADRTFGGGGRVALWTKADSVTRFDRLEIKPLR